MWKETDSGSVGSLKQCTAEAHTLVFEPVEEPACPNKFRRENTQSEKDRNRPGTGRHDHRDTENEQAEAGEDFEVPPGLLYGLYEHCVSISRLALLNSDASRAHLKTSARRCPTRYRLARRVSSADNGTSASVGFASVLDYSNSGKFLPQEDKKWNYKTCGCKSLRAQT